MRTTAPVLLTAIPDRRKRLSDGVLVEASLLARVLGLRLLTVDATVVLVPAAVNPPAARSSGALPPRSGAGRGLAEAVRNIDEGVELLAEVPRNGGDPRI